MYYSRYVEKEIERALKTSGAVLVAGPKFCGKTTTCSLFEKSEIRLNNKQTIDIARMNPKQILDGEYPRLIDEWQKVPDIWNHIKAKLDENYRFGSYILTGSSTPADKKEIHHSGAGRITPVKMRTMSLAESGESKGLVSLGEMFEGTYESRYYENGEFDLKEVAFLICRGGWPISVLSDRDISLDITRNYYNSLFLLEDSDNELFRNKRPEVLKQVLRSYARNISTEAPLQTIIEDIREQNSRTFDNKTFSDYVEALQDLFIIEDMEAWNPNIRSKTSIRTTPTRHFVDTSIACRAMNIMPVDLMNDLNSFGLFFEDFAVKELRIYASSLRGEVRHYRDNTGLECDSVVHLEDGRWAAIEIKLGGDKLINEGAENLKRLRKKLAEKSDEKAPAFLMILTATGPLYQRDDGVYVVPVNCLKA